MPFPPVIKNSVGEDRPPGVFGRNNDPAKYIIERRRFERPTLRVPPKGPKFEWPGGVEGMGISGQVGTAEHRYLGDNAPVVQVVHRDARRIEMRGMLPGLTGAANMRDLLEVITAVVPLGYWILSLPAGIFPKEQQVIVADYNFDHPEDDANDSWSYTISLIRTGVGSKVKVPKKTKPPVNPTGKTKKKPKGKPSRIFVTKNGGNTLRAVAQLVYGNPNRWKEIYNKNKQLLTAMGPLHLLQHKRLPYGLKLRY